MTAKKGSVVSGVAAMSPAELERLTGGDPDVVLLYQDLRDLTVGQVEEIEDMLDSPIHVLFDQTKPLGKVHRTVAYVVRKALDESFTYEDSYRLKLWLYDPAQDDASGNGDAPAVEGSRPPTKSRRTGARNGSTPKST